MEKLTEISNLDFPIWFLIELLIHTCRLQCMKQWSGDLHGRRGINGKFLTSKLVEFLQKSSAVICREIGNIGDLGRVDKRDSHQALIMIQAGICDGGQFGTSPYVGRGMGVL